MSAIAPSESASECPMPIGISDISDGYAPPNSSDSDAFGHFGRSDCNGEQKGTITDTTDQAVLSHLRRAHLVSHRGAS
jgi:hypothetical protein